MRICIISLSSYFCITYLTCTAPSNKRTKKEDCKNRHLQGNKVKLLQNYMQNE